MIFLVILLFLQSTNLTVCATNEKTYYARVMFDNVYLYKTPYEDNEPNNVYFELPITYFVELIDKDGNFFKARYLDFYGYVKKDSVQAVDSKPKTPFLENINFRVYADLSQNLWTLPNTEENSQLITKIPILTDNIQYIGKISGQCLIQERTNVWYFCKFVNSQEYYGYVYSDFCDKMSAISNNTEALNYIDNPTFEVEKTPTKTIPITNNYVGIIVGILSIPALILIFLVMKSSKLLANERNKRKEIVDY